MKNGRNWLWTTMCEKIQFSIIFLEFCQKIGLHEFQPTFHSQGYIYTSMHIILSSCHLSPFLLSLLCCHCFHVPKQKPDSLSLSTLCHFYLPQLLPCLSYILLCLPHLSHASVLSFSSHPYPSIKPHCAAVIHLSNVLKLSTFPLLIWEL